MGRIAASVMEETYVVVLQDGLAAIHLVAAVAEGNVLKANVKIIYTYFSISYVVAISSLQKLAMLIVMATVALRNDNCKVLTSKCFFGLNWSHLIIMG